MKILNIITLVMMLLAVAGGSLVAISLARELGKVSAGIDFFGGGALAPTPAPTVAPVCATPSTPVPTPTPALVTPTPIGTVTWTDEEIVQVLELNEEERKTSGDWEGDTELHLSPPDLVLPSGTASGNLLSVLYTTDPQDRQPVVVVVETGEKTIAWIVKRAEPGRYVIFPWKLWYVPEQVLDLNEAESSGFGMKFKIRYAVRGMGELEREISVIFPLG